MSVDTAELAVAGEVDVDTLIATEVMGWHFVENEWCNAKGQAQRSAFHPSTDTADAFAVIDAFSAKKWRFSLERGCYGDSTWFAYLGCQSPFVWATASGPTRCLAICRAAWKARKGATNKLP